MDFLSSLIKQVETMTRFEQFKNAGLYIQWRENPDDNWFGGNNGAGGNAHLEIID
jgi:hypothetical protein